MSDTIKKIEQASTFMRKKILEISYKSSHSAHLGGGLSMVEIMATLYCHILNFDKNSPHSENRDRFILSKGHAGAGVYAALAECGFMPLDKLKTHS